MSGKFITSDDFLISRKMCAQFSLSIHVNCIMDRIMLRLQLLKPENHFKMVLCERQFVKLPLTSRAQNPPFSS